MDAKEYLSGISLINAKLRNKIDELDELSDYPKEVQNALINEIIALRDERWRRIQVIEELPLNQYQLMYMKYVRGMSYAEMMEETGRSYTWATSTHQTALAKVQKILGGQNDI